MSNNFQNGIEQSFQSLMSIVKVILLSRWYVKLPRGKTADCIILANGPSLGKTLEEKIGFITKGDKEIFVVNYFINSPFYEKIKPQYYVLNAPEFWIDTTTEMHKRKRKKLFEDLNAKTNWDMKIFVPFEAGKTKLWKNLFDKNKHIEVVYYNKTPVEGLRWVNNLLFKYNLGMPRPYNVLIPSIFLALNMGFKTIYLFGADHSWHEEIRVDEKNTVLVNHQHFYDNSSQIKPMYHLDGKEYYIHDVFRKLYLAFKGYFVLKDYAGSLGAKILNASEKSYIDAFEKIKI